jgi:hypothetical protein
MRDNRPRFKETRRTQVPMLLDPVHLHTNESRRPVGQGNVTAASGLGMGLGF